MAAPCVDKKSKPAPNSNAEELLNSYEAKEIKTFQQFLTEYTTTLNIEAQELNKIKASGTYWVDEEVHRVKKQKFFDLYLREGIKSSLYWALIAEIDPEDTHIPEHAVEEIAQAMQLDGRQLKRLTYLVKKQVTINLANNLVKSGHKKYRSMAKIGRG